MGRLADAPDLALALNFVARERRRHQRVKVALSGRYMLADQREFSCKTQDMSPGGVALLGPETGNVGSRVVVYLDQIGRLEGTVARHLANGFALSLNVTAAKREKLAEQLTWLANRHILGVAEDRRHERIIPRIVRSTLKLDDGREYRAVIVDVSRSGVAVRCDIQPPIGDLATVGRTHGVVVRHFPGGVALEFSRIMPDDAFDESVEL
jgi:hypothetical protein